MAPNSHVINWLRSVYRRVLHRQWVSDARRAVAADAFARRPIERMENLESRVMLTATDFLDSPKSTYTTTPTLTDPIKSALVTGLGSVATKLESLSQSGDFSTDVPGVLEYDKTFPFDAPKAKNLAAVLGAVNGSTLKNVIQTEVIDKVNALASGSLLSALDFTVPPGNAGTLLNPLPFTIDTSNVQLTLVSGTDDYQLTFDISITVKDETTPNLHFDLGRNADQFGIRPTTSNPYFPSFLNEVELEAGLAVNLTAGVKVNISEGNFDGDGDAPDTRVNVVNAQNDFFVRGAVLGATAKIETPADPTKKPLAAAMQFGFLDVNLLVDTFDLDGRINLSLNGGAEVGYADIGNATATAATLGTIDAKVKVTVDDVGGTGFASDFGAPADGYEVQFFGTPLGAAVSSIGGSSDPRTAPQVQLDADADSILRAFKNVEPGAIVGLLKSFIDRLGTLPASSVLSLPLPLTKNKTLGQVIPLGDLATNALIFDSLNAATGNKLVDKDGNPQFRTAQTLATKLASLLGVPTTTVDPKFILVEDGSSARKLLFTVGFDAKFDPAVLEALKTSDIGFDIDLGAVAGIESTAKVKVTPSGKIGFTFGIDLAAPGQDKVVIAPPIIDSQIRAVLNSSGNVQTPSNGVLTKQAGFKLTIGGGLGGTVNVILPAGNYGSIDGVVAALQARINQAIDAVPTLDSTQPGGKVLVEVGKLADGRLTLSSAFTTFLLVKKLAAPDDTGGFLTELGFMDGQQASSAPTPANGRLRGDAPDFQIRIGASPTVHSVGVKNTHGNDTVDDLVSDINQGLKDAGLELLVGAQRIGGSNGIMLVALAAGDRVLQIVAAGPVIEQNLGWQDRQVNGEIAVAGANELVVQGTATAPPTASSPAT